MAMHKIVMWLGGITAGIGVFFIVMIMVTAKGFDKGSAIVAALGIGGSLVLSGCSALHFRVDCRAPDRH
jgi:hypothetical protein